VCLNATLNRYYFHTCENGNLTHDDTGAEFPDLLSVTNAAVRGLADLATDVLRTSRKKTDFSVEVHDEEGRRVLKTNLAFDIEHD
jgi:Domain of unknown function (DUF6894)